MQKKLKLYMWSNVESLGFGTYVALGRSVGDALSNIDLCLGKQDPEEILNKEDLEKILFEELRSKNPVIYENPINIAIFPDYI